MEEKLQIYESKILDAQKRLEKIITKYSDFESDNAKKIISIQKEIYKHMDNHRILQKECQNMNKAKEEIHQCKYNKFNWKYLFNYFQKQENHYKLSEIKPLLDKNEM
jgi:hypothetical protein